MKISDLQEDFELSILFSELGPFKQAFKELGIPWQNPQQTTIGDIVGTKTQNTAPGRIPGLYFIVAPALPGYEKLVHQMAADHPLPTWENPGADIKGEKIIPLYIGISSDEIRERHKTHKMKVLQDFKSLLKIAKFTEDQIQQLANGNTEIIKTIRGDDGHFWKNPENWRKFLNLFLSGDPKEIPLHFKEVVDSKGKVLRNANNKKLFEPDLEALNQYNPNWLNQLTEPPPGRNPEKLPVLVWHLNLTKHALEFIEGYANRIYKPLFNNTPDKNKSLADVMTKKPAQNDIYKPVTTTKQTKKKIAQPQTVAQPQVQVPKKEIAVRSNEEISKIWQDALVNPTFIKTYNQMSPLTKEEFKDDAVERLKTGEAIDKIFKDWQGLTESKILEKIIKLSGLK